MANANTSGSGAHNGHWTATATQAGTYEFPTGGKFVDRNIDLVIPEGGDIEIKNTSGGEASEITSVTVSPKAGGGYTITGGGTSESKTVTVGPTQSGFILTTDTTDVSVTGGEVNVNADIAAGVATPSETIDSVSVSTISTAMTKSGNNYTKSVNSTVNGTVATTVTTDGYITATDQKSDNFSETKSTTVTVNAATATSVISGTVPTPTISKGTGNAVSGAITTTQPSTGHYVTVTSESAAVTPTNTITVTTAGYLGNKSEITASGSLSKSGTRTSYVPITDSTTTDATINVNGTNKVATITNYNYTEGYSEATTIPYATFANVADTGNGKTDASYTDLSDALMSVGGSYVVPILTSGGYLYINKGYVNDIKVSLAHLVPDTIPGKTFAGSNQMLEGYAAFDADGNPITGQIATKIQSDLSASASGATVTATVPAGYYAEQYTVEKSVATGSVNSLTIDETTQGGVIASVSATTPTSGYYPVSVASLKATVNRTQGYISGTTSTANDSNGGVVGKIKASTTSKTDGTATVNTTATNNLASGTTTTAAAAGYTYHVDTSATATTTAASVEVGVGYVGTAVSAATIGDTKTDSKSVYILDSTAKVGTTDMPSGSTINAGSTITIGKGYYPTDRTFKAQDAGSALEKSGITGTLSANAITTGYTAPTLVTTTTQGVPYLTLSGNGSMVVGNIFNGTATAETKYMEVYAGTYSIT